MTHTHSLDVGLGPRSYPIHIGPGLLSDAPSWCTHMAGRHVLVVSNTTVAPLYLERVMTGLDGFTASSLALPDGEQYKTLEHVQRVFDALAELGASRDACIVALGGGVIGDLAGFAAACWMRGIDFIQMPTTLLAMVDSSVGGKTGVNLPAGKNLVGAFHQPRVVIADTDTLDSLPGREYRAGLAEVVKYGALGNADFLTWLEAHADALNNRDAAVIAEAIAQCCAHKAAIVARDETERGERALLNLGHTFGHALETECGYGTLLHGEAVAIGMCQAAALSTRLGMAEDADRTRLATLLDTLGLPTTPPPDLDPDALLAHMRLDKKNLGGRLRLILWRGVGRAEMVEGVDEAEVTTILSQPSSGRLG
jgi:3-dehydroquinate synthase